MIIRKNDSIIIIEINEDEEETFNYMGLVFLETQINNLFQNRKRQHEEDMRVELTKGMNRNQLKEELARKKNG